MLAERIIPEGNAPYTEKREEPEKPALLAFLLGSKLS
jgi:hypothetical protein